MLRTGIVFASGLVFACYSPWLIDSVWVSLLPIVLFITACQPAFRDGGVMLSGFLWASLAIYVQIDHQLPVQLNHKRLVMVGEVINIPQNSFRSIRFQIRPITFSVAAEHMPKKVKLNWRDAPEKIHPGQVWRLVVKLKQAHGYQNPGGFDYERWLFSHAIQATGYVLKSPQNQLLETPPFSLNGWRDEINRHINSQCRDCRHAGLMQALATGYRGSLTLDTRSLLQQTGTAHLIAVSGLHIGIIAGIFHIIGLQWWRRSSWLQQWVRFDVAMLVSWFGGLFYSLLSGFELPAQRALMMLSVLLLIRLLRLPFNLLQATMVAVLLVLIVSPLAVLTSSFWLTLNALLIIIFASQHMRQQHGWLKNLVILQLLFALLYIPVSLVIFNQLHPASFFANLLAVPWVSLVIVPFNFLLLLFFWLPDGLLQPLYALLDVQLDGLIGFLTLLDENGFSAINQPAASIWWLLLFIVAAFLLLQPGRMVSRFILLMGLPLFIFWHPRQPPLLRVAVLDVGMGTSIVLQTRHHSMVYDFGPGNRRGYSLGLWAVQPFLKNAGIDQPDRIVLSHAAQDHIGGFYALQDDYAALPVFSGMDAVLKLKIPSLSNLHDCHQTPRWQWDQVSFEFLTTAHDVTDRDNDRSCVLKVTAGQQRILLTGDIERRQEQRLLQQYPDQLQADILIAPHHGSLTSSSPDFIRAVGAGQVIFSSGFLNRWKFPRAKIVQRYHQSGARTHNTADSGAVLINCRTTECRLESYRRRHWRIWY